MNERKRVECVMVESCFLKAAIWFEAFNEVDINKTKTNETDDLTIVFYFFVNPQNFMQRSEHTTYVSEHF